MRSSEVIYVPVATDPVSLSYDPAVAGQPAIPFSTKLRNTILIRLILRLGLYPIGNGLFQPAIYRSINDLKRLREKKV